MDKKIDLFQKPKRLFVFVCENLSDSAWNLTKTSKTG